MRGDHHRPPDEEPDFHDIAIRVAGWLALGTGLGMLVIFLLWLRGQ